MSAAVRRLPIAPRALLVIDRPVLAELVAFALNHGVFLTPVAATVAAALTAVAAGRPHLIISDMDLIGGDRLEELRHVPPDRPPLSVIALTRRGDLTTTLDAFARGVDDILTVPFSPEELVARALAVMRRAYRAEVPFTPVLHVGELEIDILNRLVRVNGHALHLTVLEQSLLYLLAANADRLLTRDEILDHLWGPDYAAESTVVNRHVRTLRAKLRDDRRRPRFIATAPGQGYRFKPRHDMGNE